MFSYSDILVNYIKNSTQCKTRWKCRSRIKAGSLLTSFQHKWMFLSTMQTLPNQIPFEPAEMSFSVEWGFYSCWICTRQDQKQVSVPKEFGLLGVWFTEFTLYQPFSWALKEKVDLLWNPDCLCLHQWIVQKCSCWKSTWQGLCK